LPETKRTAEFDYLVLDLGHNSQMAALDKHIPRVFQSSQEYGMTVRCEVLGQRSKLPPGLRRVTSAVE
jgi:hypothetical protein